MPARKGADSPGQFRQPTPRTAADEPLFTEQPAVAQQQPAPVAAQQQPAVDPDLENIDAHLDAAAQKAQAPSDDEIAAAAAADDPGFTRGGARRPMVSDPRIQWATGLLTTERSLYAGFLVEADQDPELDGALAEAGYNIVNIRHGGGNTVAHWRIETASMFFVASGLQSMQEMARTDERYGIAFAWTTSKGRNISQLRARVMLRELLRVGYEQPLTLSMKGTITGDLLRGLLDQFAVLDAIAAFRRQATPPKPQIDLPFYSCSIPIGPGKEVTRGTGGNTKEITPPLVMIPKPVTKEYVLEHWIEKRWTPIIERQLDETIRWSVNMTAQIAAGEENGDHTYQGV